MLDDARQVADPVAVAVGEAARVDLVDDAAAPPVGAEARATARRGRCPNDARPFSGPIARGAWRPARPARPRGPGRPRRPPPAPSTVNAASARRARAAASAALGLGQLLLEPGPLAIGRRRPPVAAGADAAASSSPGHDRQSSRRRVAPRAPRGVSARSQRPGPGQPLDRGAERLERRAQRGRDARRRVGSHVGRRDARLGARRCGSPGRAR